MDAPLAIGFGQTISQPYMVGLMSELLRVNVRCKVLEVGAGSGYQTAVLAELAGEVFAIERLAPLAERARGVLKRLHYDNVSLAIGDGTRGWREAAPFDRILVAAAADKAPSPLLEQLGEKGRLIIPIGPAQSEQELTVFVRAGERFVRESSVSCRFVPLVDDRDREGESEGPAARAGELPSGPGWQQTREEAGMKAVDARVYGRVHGVYFRATARAEGERLGLRGWVRNVDDGTVALRLQGDPAAVDAMLDWCSVGPPAARVGRVEVSDAVPDSALTSFEVH